VHKADGTRAITADDEIKRNRVVAMCMCASTLTCKGKIPRNGLDARPSGRSTPGRMRWTSAPAPKLLRVNTPESHAAGNKERTAMMSPPPWLCRRCMLHCSTQPEHRAPPCKEPSSRLRSHSLGSSAGAPDPCMWAKGPFVCLVGWA
jgi:hypothetical protein